MTASEIKDWLERIPPNRVYLAEQTALMRLQMFLTGETHRILSEMAAKITQRLLKAGEGEPIDAALAFQIQGDAALIWRETMTQSWLPLMQALRREAASLAFGGLAVQINSVLGQVRKITTETQIPRRTRNKSFHFEEAVVDGIFSPQLNLLIQALNQRIYMDGLTLSSRIWKFDQESQEGIRRVIMQGVQDGSSAWDVAKKLEKYLGANSDCPRWTATRLYRLTKTDIALGNKTGLVRSEDCAGQGVAYNALRMARNEIQAIHHMANDAQMAEIPWIEKEQIVLSAAHPPLGCDCETVVAGGEGGQGIYPKGTITLPLHVGCLCFKLGLQPERKEFTSRLRAWMRQEESWPGMNEFASRYGDGVSASDSTAIALGVWIFGDQKDILGRLF